MAPATTGTELAPVQPCLFLLGAFHLEYKKRMIHFPTRKIESLFAFLALHPEPHSREKLASLLWGDSTDELARRSLRTALAAIRKELGNEFVIADRETVQLNPNFPIWVDAREIFDLRLPIADFEIENQESKIKRYAGDLLPDFYDDWILPERERLRAIYLDALLQLVQKYRTKSEYARAIELAQKVLATEPTNEHAYQHVIFCLAATGDRSSALKQFDDCTKKLRDELNVAPSRETIALCAQIQAELTGGQAREAWLTNLPVPLTSFVGRRNEIAEVKQLLGTTHLVTLIGAGGCGKTRLAIQVGTELAAGHCFKQGVWWVDLSALQDPAQVVHSVATVFDLHESEHLPLISLITNYLRTKYLLLILDNCEQLIDACAQLVGTLLPACPQLRILATSRERLSASGEFVWYVPSMALPQTEMSLDQLLQFDAIQLFTERARAVQSHWSLLGNGKTVTRICQQLDGIPLAIELAAARLGVLSVEQIDARLADRFHLLMGGSRTELPRHQTLRAAIDWSYELLSDAERAVFRQLSVFAGGWTLEAAEAVLTYNALDYLTALIDKSLVVVEQKGNAMRYRFLETIRQYARERLEESGEANLIQDRHLGFYLTLAKQAELELRGDGQVEWLDRLDLEHDNLWAALEGSLKANVTKGLELGWSLLLFWDYRGYWGEGKEWTDLLLACVSDHGLAYAQGLFVASVFNTKFGTIRTSQQNLEQVIVIARALGVAGKWLLALGLGDLGNTIFSDNAQMGESMLEEGLAISKSIKVDWITARLLEYQASMSFGKHDWKTALEGYQDSLAIYQALGDKRNMAFVMASIGRILFRQHDPITGCQYMESSLLFARETRDRPSILRLLVNLGEVYRAEGKYDLAKQYTGEALELAQELSAIRAVWTCLNNLGAIALYENEYQRAKSFYASSLVLVQKINSKPFIAGNVRGVGGLLALEKKACQATHFLAVYQKFTESGDMRTPSQADSVDYQRYVALVRSQLDEATFNTAWAEGCKMTLEQALEYALENVK